MADINKKELAHSIGAAFVMIVAFLLCVYVAVPLVFKFMAWYGFNFVPERMGGGSEIGNEGFLQLIFRGIAALVFSGYASFMAGEHFFPHQIPKMTLISAVGMIVIFFVSVFAYGALNSSPALAPTHHSVAVEAPKAPPAQLPMSSAKMPPVAFQHQPVPVSAVQHVPPTPEEPKKPAYRSVKRVYLVDGSYMQCRSAVLSGGKVRVETVMQDIVEFNREEINMKRTFTK